MDFETTIVLAAVFVAILLFYTISEVASKLTLKGGLNITVSATRRESDTVYVTDEVVVSGLKNDIDSARALFAVTETIKTFYDSQ